METTDFLQNLNDVINNGMVSLAMALGNELGLFDALCHHFTAPASIQEIADETKLKPRYVQEWLGGMVAACVVQIVNEDDVMKYVIPLDYRSRVTVAAKKSSALLLLAKRQDRIKACFRRDGPCGFDYLDYPETFDWLTGVNDVTMPDICDKDILPCLDESLAQQLEEGSWVVDIGCGSGELITYLAGKFPHSSFIGLDTSTDALHKARARTIHAGICNVTWQQGDTHNLPEGWIACFDWVIMYDVLHDLPKPQIALTEIGRILKPTGTFTVIELGLSSKHEQNVGDRLAAVSYTFSMYACLPCSLTEVQGHENNCQEGATTTTTEAATCSSSESAICNTGNPGMGVDTMSSLLTENGFRISQTTKMTADPENTMIICKKTSAGKMERPEIEPHLEQTALSLG